MQIRTESMPWRPTGVHTALDGRVRTLEQTGKILFTLGLASRPLPADKVHRIEQKALKKLKTGLIAI